MADVKEETSDITSNPDTSEEQPEKKEPVAEDATSETEQQTELDKYWQAVKENPQDFTGWTYLLQYVEQENNLGAARNAFEAFLEKYPYCYGYWKKYADMEKRNENHSKAEAVFENGVKAIALSIELWIHYLNFTINQPEPGPGHEDSVRALFERALAAAGTSFKSDKLWDMYLMWEKDNSNLKNVTKIYDRLISIPTQLYSHHFEQLTEHINKHHPKEVLMLDDFLTLRQEVLKESKAKEQVMLPDVAPPGSEDDAPPGECTATSTLPTETKIPDDKEIACIREKAIEKRKKIFQHTEQEVSRRWSFEEGIRRPYFHVKPLEKSQLQNWRDYLEFEIENGSKERVMVLFERCIIACALYEEFWMKYATYMEPISADGVRNVYRRVCTLHLPQKPTLHLAWAAFEEKINNPEEAIKIIENIETITPGLTMVHLRRISLERRQGDSKETQDLYEKAIINAKSQDVKSFYSIKYSRYLAKVLHNHSKAKEVLQEALKTHDNNVKLYLQLIDLEYQQADINEEELMKAFDSAVASSLAVEHRVAFSQRRLEYLEDLGSSVDRLLGAYNAHQRLVDDFHSSSKKRKNSEDDSTGSDAKKAKTDGITNGTSDQISSTTDQQQSAYNYSQWGGYGQNAYAGYPGWGGYGYYGQ